MLAVAVAVASLAGRLPGPLPDADGAVAVPLVTGSHDNLLVTAWLGDRPVRLVVDTGATKTILDVAAARRAGVTAFNQEIGLATTVAGAALVMRHAVVPAVRVGPAVAYKPLVGVTDLSRSVARGGVADGVMGADLLAQFGAVIDYDRRALKVRTPSLRDLAAMQGRWRVVEYQQEGKTYHLRDYPKLGNIRAEVTGTHLRVDHSRAGRGVEEYNLHLQPHHRPKRFVGSDYRRDGKPDPPSESLPGGLYEVQPGRLRWLSSATKSVELDEMPKELVAGPGSGLAVFTFERPPPSVGWQVLQLAVGRFGLDHPAGWEIDLAPDWTLTGVHPGRRLRFRATPGGDMSIEALRP